MRQVVSFAAEAALAVLCFASAYQSAQEGSAISAVIALSGAVLWTIMAATSFALVRFENLRDRGEP